MHRAGSWPESGPIDRQGWEVQGSPGESKGGECGLKTASLYFSVQIQFTD